VTRNSETDKCQLRAELRLVWVACWESIQQSFLGLSLSDIVACFLLARRHKFPRFGWRNFERHHQS